MEFTKAQALPFHEVLWLQGFMATGIGRPGLQELRKSVQIKNHSFLPNIDICLNLNFFVPPERVNEDF